jgi:type IV secretory pathway protease TraF
MARDGPDGGSSLLVKRVDTTVRDLTVTVAVSRIQVHGAAIPFSTPKAGEGRDIDRRGQPT